MTTAVVTVDKETGEVLAPPAFDLAAYLHQLNSPEGVALAAAFAGAYDKAVRAMVGPNDVQKEGGREFKKKSAWAKLARYFNISTKVISVESRDLESGHIHTRVIVQATAPWGQVAEAVAGCSTEEPRFARAGGRVRARADVEATAETRASNRAISRLIAAGEVSAEEVAGTPAKAAGDKRMPFGKHKGTPLAEVPRADLEATIQWCREKDAKKFADLIAACEAVLRPGAAEMSEMPEALIEDDDDSSLPF